MKSIILKTSMFVGLFIFSQHVFAALDSAAESIKLLKNCNSETNCTTLPSEMIDWVNTARTDKNKHVLVNIGPGAFSMPTSGFFCNQSNNVSYTGAGRNITVLTGGGPSFLSGNIHDTVINIKDCNNLSFKDLTIEADTWSNPASTGSRTGIEWAETADSNGNKKNTKSHWTNIDVKAGHNGWYDDGGVHFFYGSSIHTQSISTVDGMAPYYSQGGETWFYGGELVSIHNSPESLVVVTGVIMNGGEIQIFGSSVRVIAKPGAGQVTPVGFGGFLAISNGKIHMHGGIVAVHAKDMTVPQDVYSVATNASFGAGGVVHTPGTAFALSPGSTGTAYRIKPNGTASAQSPFLWPSGTSLPNISSVTGSDIFVETDCDDTGDCENPTGAVHPHIMVYDVNCTASSGPWFDSTRGVCRGE